MVHWNVISISREIVITIIILYLHIIMIYIFTKYFFFIYCMLLIIRFMNMEPTLLDWDLLIKLMLIYRKALFTISDNSGFMKTSQDTFLPWVTQPIQAPNIFSSVLCNIICSFNQYKCSPGKLNCNGISVNSSHEFENF